MYTDSYETNLELLSVVLPIRPVGKYRESGNLSPPTFGRYIYARITPIELKVVIDLPYSN